MDGDPPPAATGGGAAVALLAATGAVVALSVFAGGASQDARLHTVGGLALVVAALAGVAALRGRLPVPRLGLSGRVVLAGALALTVWVGLSLAWSIVPDQSWLWLNRSLVYLACGVLGLLVGALAGGRRALAGILAVVFGAALGWALLGVIVPSLAEDGDRVARLREPIGYWNALALVADASIALGLWLAASQRRTLRLPGVLLVFAAVVVVGLTQSRAGVLAAVVVVGFALSLAPRRLELALLGLCGAVPAVVVTAWAFSRPALVEDGAGRAARVDDGRLFAFVLAVGALVALCLALWLPARELVERHRRAVARALVVVALAGAVIAGGVLVASVGNPLSWAADQVDGGECANDPGRLTELCDNNRLSWWRDAVDVARERPLAGAGAGAYAVARLRVRGDATPVSEPHSVPLQLLADLGTVGLALGLVTALASLLGVVSGVRRLGGPERWDAVAVASLPLAWGLHALVDFDLDFLAVTGPALVAVGSLLGAGLAVRIVRVSWPGLVAVAAVTLAAIASLWLPALAQNAVDRVYGAGDVQAAADAAARARSLDPLSLDPVFAQAYVAELVGDRARAQALYEEATRMQPENPAPWLELGRFHGSGVPPDFCAAYTAYNEAYTLDPQSSRWVPGGPFDVAKDAVNKGACEP